MTIDHTPAPEGSLRRATTADAPELLVLQRCCWVTEAIVNDTLDIPALHEDEAAVRASIERTSVWIVRREHRLVASVRAHLDGDSWEIGRLMVAPDLRGAGVGRRLLAHVESQAPERARRFALFTGQRSTRNLRMYTAAGYEPAAPSDTDRYKHIAGAVLLTKPRPSITRVPLGDEEVP